jgi:ATP-dependent DNA ligase
LPTKAPRPPSGEAWLHEIKHDGFRVIARKNGNGVADLRCADRQREDPQPD